MAKDNSKILEMIERGHTTQQIRRATRMPIMRIAGVRAAHTKAKAKNHATPSISLKPATDSHKLVTQLLNLGVDAKLIAAASGRSPSVICAIKAHITMGTYK